MNNYYNVGARYKIIGRITDKTSVTSYVLKDLLTNEIGNIDKGTVEQMALNKQIYNCNAQVYKELVNLKGINCKISKLPRYDEEGYIIEEDIKPKKKVEPDLELVAKVQKGRLIHEYILVNIRDPNTYIKKSKTETLQLAQDGRIINAKSQMDRGEAILRGAKGFSISQLKTFQIK